MYILQLQNKCLRNFVLCTFSLFNISSMAIHNAVQFCDVNRFDQDEHR